MGAIAFIGGNVIPMDDGKRFSAVLTVDDTIKRVGEDDEILKEAKAYDAQIIDLEGNTLLPGFHDCHVHMSVTGFDKKGINLYDAKDIPEILARLTEADESWSDDRWIYGMRIDEGLLAERRPPVMKELDCVKRPCFISDRGGHYVLVNELAFKALGIDENTPGVRKDEDGRPNGRLQDEANLIARANFPRSESEYFEALLDTAWDAVKKGVTTIHATEGFTEEDPAPEILLNHQEEFPVDLQVYWNRVPKLDDPLVAKSGILGGDILFDGSIGSRTAAFYDNYEDGDGNGYFNYDIDEMRSFVEDAIVHDLVMDFHTIGERAIHTILKLYEECMEKHPEKKGIAKLRLEHFGWPSEEDLELAAKYDVRISTQPAFTYLRGGPESIYRSRLGEARERRAYPLRKMLDYGLCVGGGSDSDITPLDPLLGIHSAVNPPYPENAITPYEAVRMYTSEAARCGWEDDKKGKIREGMQADLVILAEDPMSVDPRSIKDIEVLATIRKGEILYNKLS